MRYTIYTIGHSSLEINAFVGLLQKHKITSICDVRSQPYSGFVPQYSKDTLRTILNKKSISYRHFGKELGGRSENLACYDNNKVQYELLLEEPIFMKGMDNLLESMGCLRCALLCSEKDPIDCHRGLLLGRYLFMKGMNVLHVHTNGTLESQDEMEIRLLRLWKMDKLDLFKSTDEFISDAYKMQSNKVAYRIECDEKYERTIGA